MSQLKKLLEKFRVTGYDKKERGWRKRRYYRIMLQENRINYDLNFGTKF